MEPTTIAEGNWADFIDSEIPKILTFIQNYPSEQFIFWVLLVFNAMLIPILISVYTRNKK